MTTDTDRTAEAPARTAPTPAVRPVSLDWLKGEVALVLPRWALVAAGLAALALIAVAFD